MPELDFLIGCKSPSTRGVIVWSAENANIGVWFKSLYDAYIHIISITASNGATQGATHERHA